MLFHIFSAQNIYFPLRFVDCNMVMQYHWGLGIGHTYAHVQSPTKDDSNSSQPILEQPTVAKAAASNTSSTTGDTITSGSPAKLTRLKIKIHLNHINVPAGNPTKTIEVGDSEAEDKWDDNSDDNYQPELSKLELDNGSVLSDDSNNFMSNYYVF